MHRQALRECWRELISLFLCSPSRGYGAYFWVIAYWKKIVKDGRRVAKSVAMLEVLIYERRLKYVWLR